MYRTMIVLILAVVATNQLVQSQAETNQVQLSNLGSNNDDLRVLVSAGKDKTVECMNVTAAEWMAKRRAANGEPDSDLKVVLIVNRTQSVQCRIKQNSVTAISDDLKREIFNLGFRVFNLLHRNDKEYPENFVISPTGLSLGLGQLLLAANDDLALQIAEQLLNWRHGQMTLHQNLTNVLRKLQQETGSADKSDTNMADTEVDIQVNLQSAIFYQNDVALKQVFTDRSAKYYNTQFVPLIANDSASRKQRIIDDWVKKVTNNLITEFPVPSDFAVFMANTVYFEGDWQFPFADEYSGRDSFYLAPRKEVEVLYMRGQEDVPFYENKQFGFTMIRMPYYCKDVEKKNMSMYIVSPTGFNLREIMSKFLFEDLKDIIKDEMKIEPVNIMLPKIMVKDTVNVKGVMDKLMMKDQNTRRWSRDTKKKLMSADHYQLDQASEDRKFVLTNFVQETVLNVFEKGTRAASITGGYLDYSSGGATLKADKPYLMIIYDDMNDLVLFYGAIFNPISADFTRPSSSTKF